MPETSAERSVLPAQVVADATGHMAVSNAPSVLVSVLVPSVMIVLHLVAWGLVWRVLYQNVPEAKVVVRDTVVDLPPPVLPLLFEKPVLSSLLVTLSDTIVVHRWLAPACCLALVAGGWLLYAVPKRQRARRLVPVTALHGGMILLAAIVLWLIMRELCATYISVAVNSIMARAT